jgi:hypothetical protein
MFRFGADFSPQLTNVENFASKVDYQVCEALKTMPGLVGDSRPGGLARPYYACEEDGCREREEVFVMYSTSYRRETQRQAVRKSKRNCKKRLCLAD